MYDSGRFFTVTGRHVEETPRKIGHRQGVVEAIHAEIFGAPRENSDRRADNRPTDLTDEEVIAKAKSAKNGEKFSSLWSGDTTGYASASEADAALCSHLAYWCGPDEERIERLFRSSGLCRDKWLERPDYRRRTIEMALERSEFYGPEPGIASRAGLKEQRTKQWPLLADEAFYGLAGDIARSIEPHTEADPAALLVSILTAFGNMVGRGAHFAVGATRHHLKLYVALVGQTSKARKGTSWDPIWELARAADVGWAEERVLSGLVSGEGLIHAVRDPVVVRNKKTGEEEVADPGEPDKRLLVLEGELASVLRVMSTDGNTLSTVLRDAWDRNRLQTLAKNSPTKATGAHVSLVGHITKEELLRELGSTDQANGFANRFLWVLVRRSKVLPFGGDWQSVDAAPLIERLRAALGFGRGAGEIRWGGSARPLWEEMYGPLSEGKPGLFGAVVGRAEAQTVRLAALHAVMDRSRTIEEGHLLAALALWDYAEESARHVFGEATGDPVADQLAEALRNAGGSGMSRTEIRDLFKRHKGADRIDRALASLLGAGRARRGSESTGGRPTERWFFEG